MTFEMIKKDRQFRYIYSRGKSFANKKLVIYYLKNKDEKLRVRISICKKVGKAVVRNRLRRLIKENIRLNQNLISGYSMIFLARVGADDLDFNTMKSSINHLLKRCDLI